MLPRLKKRTGNTLIMVENAFAGKGNEKDAQLQQEYKVKHLSIKKYSTDLPLMMMCQVLKLSKNCFDNVVHGKPNKTEKKPS